MDRKANRLLRVENRSPNDGDAGEGYSAPLNDNPADFAREGYVVLDRASRAYGENERRGLAEPVYDSGYPLPFDY